MTYFLPIHRLVALAIASLMIAGPALSKGKDNDDNRQAKDNGKQAQQIDDLVRDKWTSGSSGRAR